MKERVDRNKLMKAKNDVNWKSAGKYPIKVAIASSLVSVEYNAFSHIECIIAGNTTSNVAQNT